MPRATISIAGFWKKVTASPCSEPYPDTIEFRENGLYFGQTTQPGRYTLWDVGRYLAIGDKEIEISTANDAVVRYKFSASDYVITFIDPEQCELTYQRLD